MDEPFSKRHGFRDSRSAEITVRQDAPYELRGVLVDMAYEAGLKPSGLRELVCRVLKKRPDKYNWSERPNIDNEVRGLIDDAAWYQVYDVIEAIAQSLRRDRERAEQFDVDINAYFAENGIGWKLDDGKIEVRGPEFFEETTRVAVQQLEQSGYARAHAELHEALQDLSRRPDPDVTGAIQHAMAALESVTREATGDSKATLGEILKRNPGLVPPPLDEAMNKVWGYASDHARHGREDRVPTWDEAQLTVGMAASVVSYLIGKLQSSR